MVVGVLEREGVPEPVPVDEAVAEGVVEGVPVEDTEAEGVELREGVVGGTKQEYVSCAASLVKGTEEFVNLTTATKFLQVAERGRPEPSHTLEGAEMPEEKKGSARSDCVL